ncbi:hypothetical protein B0H66DRAFT_586535 [Apodospora peruviana]|uniref:J domain-containing protein n=1 Tax=Apodospora peruviana TaxID=516989 RepID=A0AAE0IT77_9PEZI|nr:hypothetical protein B0H66DRAFT_586535 [Apodospora peruviana]
MAADTSGRNIIGARRIPSAALDDTYGYLHPAGNYSYNSSLSSHPLRPAESRYSLREQFAATRREIEFGFDDSSSILERSTIASEADLLLDDEFDDTIVVGAGSAIEPAAGIQNGGVAPPRRDYYELLCLPKNQHLSPDEIRKAFHRVVQLLCVDRQPKRLQPAAASYLGQVQIALETMIDPHKRIVYDLSRADEIGDLEVDETTSDLAYQRSVLEQCLLLSPGGIRTTTDLGLRMDAMSVLGSAPRVRQRGLGIMDYSIRQSITMDVPALREPITQTALFLRDLAEKNLSRPIGKHPLLHFADPTVTITGSTHGLLDESFTLASLLYDPYQPPGPSIHGRRRLDQLLTSRFLPVLNVNVQQEVFQDKPTSAAGVSKVLPNTVLEHELEILPQPSVTVRAGHSLDLPESQDPLNIEVSLQKHLTPYSGLVPSLGLALDRRVGPGTAFLVADAGDYDFWPSRECRELSGFSKLSSSRFGRRMNPFRNVPTIEAGYAFGGHVMGVRAGRAFTKPSDRGLRGLDHECVMTTANNHSTASSWTVSTGLTLGNAAAYLRYGKDLFFGPWTSSASTTKPKMSRRGGLRAEVELASTTAARRDLLIAFRTLKYIGQFSKVGFEVGLTPNNLHLSLYWSRLGQRISIPFLVAAKSSSSSSSLVSTRLAFWTAVLPFAAFAVWDAFLGWRRRRGSSRKASSASSKTKKGMEKNSSSSSSNTREEEVAMARKRSAEADELTVILATGVEPRQRTERQKGGLVILSAKYGAKNAPSEEIADVTVAVAAVVDDGRLRIPAGLRKDRLLGFWDPAPSAGCGSENVKMLWVRYMYRGKEMTAVVGGGDELLLP